MATTHTLKAQKRETIGTGKLNQLRQQGFMPCVVYGANMESLNIQVDTKEFAHMLANSVSEHILVNLDIDGASKLALLKDIQHDYLADRYTHADFLSVQDTTVIHSTAPVVLVGDAAGVAQGGLLDQTVHELHIQCQVKDLPESISVDVTNLNMGEALRVQDIKMPAGVTTPAHGDTPVVMIEEPKV